jgi:hypothetical protein
MNVNTTHDTPMAYVPSTSFANLHGWANPAMSQPEGGRSP